MPKNDAKVPKGVTVVRLYKPDLQKQANALLFVLGYSPPNAKTADAHSTPETPSANTPTRPPKPSARTKHLLARLLKEQQATQADSAIEEADA